MYDICVLSMKSTKIISKFYELGSNKKKHLYDINVTSYLNLQE